MLSIFKSLLILALISPVCAVAQGPKNIGTRLRQLGMTLVHVPVQDFTLNELEQSKSKSLREYKGKWILLNFWATWCGPCRAELPSLEGLYQETRGSNFQVLGVSIDQGQQSEVKRFASSLGITFPNFHDQKNKVSQDYQASSVPSAYLISPNWKVVGILQGAINWENPAIIQLMKEIASHKKLPKGLNSTSVPNTANQSLPNNLTPPQLSIQIDQAANSKALKKGLAYKLKILIKWPENPSKYFVKVPKFNPPSDIHIGFIEAYSKKVQGINYLIYEYPIRFKKTGNFFLGPFTLEYRPRSGGSLRAARHSGIKVYVTKSFLFLKILLSLGFLISFVFSFLIFQKRKQKTKTVLSLRDKKKKNCWRSEYEKLKSLKSNLDRRNYLLSLIGILKKADQSLYEEGRWPEKLEKIKYAGLAFEDYELNYIEKTIENRMKKMEEF